MDPRSDFLVARANDGSLDLVGRAATPLFAHLFKLPRFLAGRRPRESLRVADFGYPILQTGRLIYKSDKAANTDHRNGGPPDGPYRCGDPVDARSEPHLSIPRRNRLASRQSARSRSNRPAGERRVA